MSTFRRIAAACALIAVMAVGLAAPVEAGARRDDPSASAGSLDTALVAASTRRVRGTGTDRGPGSDELDGRAGHPDHFLGLSHALWLASAVSFEPPAAAPAGAVADQPSRAPAAPLVASRSSRGPPRAFVTL